VSANIRELLHTGRYSHPQAIAIALEKAGLSYRKRSVRLPGRAADDESTIELKQRRRRRATRTALEYGLPALVGFAIGTKGDDFIQVRPLGVRPMALGALVALVGAIYYGGHTRKGRVFAGAFAGIASGVARRAIAEASARRQA
jgi:hypothetical protein